MKITVRVGALNHAYQMAHSVIPDTLYVGDKEYMELKEALGQDGALIKYNGYVVHRVNEMSHLCVCKGGTE